LYSFPVNLDILKFFSLEKGTLLHDKTSDKDNSSIINGSFSYDDLLKVLDHFINKYVCCPSKPMMLL